MDGPKSPELLVPDEGIEPPTFGLQNPLSGSDNAGLSRFC